MMLIIKRATLGMVFSALRCTLSSGRVSFYLCKNNVGEADVCECRKLLTLPSTLFLESRFACYSVTVFNWFNALQLCKCSLKQNGVLLSVYDTSNSLHTLFLKL